MQLPINYNDAHWTVRKNAREQYIVDQKGKCAFCKTPLEGSPADYVRILPINKKLFPKGFFDHPIHLHHDHSTGMTIGAIHNTCNAVLWQYHGE